VKLRDLAACALSAAALAAFAGVAEARNPHCAGGIQYFSQALADKSKGNTDDYNREIGKAVAQLTQCASEDPTDLEAIGYLGMAYADIDSTGPAGVAFDKAIAGMKARSDKKLDWVVTNRQSYWAIKFNDGIAKINAGQALYPNMNEKPADDATKTAREQATKSYESAVVSLTKAMQLKPNDPQTIGNLSVAYALMGDRAHAKELLEAGLKVNPDDAVLKDRLDILLRNAAADTLASGNYDAAIRIYGDAVKKNDKDGDAWSSLADAYFKRAGSYKDKADPRKKTDYKASGDAYVKAAQLKNGDPDLCYNAAVAYSNAGLAALAEPQWECVLSKRPDDVEALSGYASTLADLKKFSKAQAALHHALGVKPDDANLHRQLGGVFALDSKQPESYKEMVMYFALDKGVEAAKPSGATGSAEAQTVSTEGAPEKVLQWEADGQKYETLLYLKKSRAYTFKAGVLVVKSDWAPAAGGA
jgi:tetratricopeptide (TPR) repeat protein